MQKYLYSSPEPDLNLSNTSQQNCHCPLGFQRLNLRHTATCWEFEEHLYGIIFPSFLQHEFPLFLSLTRQESNGRFASCLPPSSGGEACTEPLSYHCLSDFQSPRLETVLVSNNMVSESTQQRGWMEFANHPLLTYSFLTSGSMMYCFFNYNSSHIWL